MGYSQRALTLGAVVPLSRCCARGAAMTPDIYPVHAQTRKERLATTRGYISKNIGRLTMKVMGKHLGMKEKTVYRHTKAMGLSGMTERTVRLLALRTKVRELLVADEYTEGELLKAFGARYR